MRIRLSFLLWLWILPIFKSRSPVSPIVSFLLIRFVFKNWFSTNGRILISNPTRLVNLPTSTYPTPYIKGDPQTPTANLELFSLWGSWRRWRRNFSSTCDLPYSNSEKVGFEMKRNFGAKPLSDFSLPVHDDARKIQCALQRVSCKRAKYTQHRWAYSIRSFFRHVCAIISVFNNCTFALSERVWWILSFAWDKTHTIWKITYCWRANVLSLREPCSL